MDRKFEITKIAPLGDPTNGEAYTVQVAHECPEQDEKVIMNAGFGKQCKGSTLITCDKCGSSVTLNKDISNERIVYIA